MISAMFVLLEAGLQIFYYSRVGSPFPAGLRQEDRDHRDAIKLNPNFRGTSKYGIEYVTNDRGFRDDPIDPGKDLILFLGDSTTFGLNIPHEKTYPEQLEVLLRQKGREVQALNAASPGQGTLDELEILQYLFKDPTLGIRAVVLGFFPNDFSNNFAAQNPNHAQGEKSDFLFTLKSIDYFKAAINILSEKIAGYQRSRYLKDSLSQETNPSFYGNAKRFLNEKGEYAPRPGREVEWDWLTEEELHQNRSFQITLQALDRIEALCQAKKIPFVFLYLPSGNRPSGEGEISFKAPRFKGILEGHLSQREGVHLLDAAKIYSDRLGKDKNFPADFYSIGRDAGHPGPLACRWIAEGLHEAMDVLN